MKSGLSIVAAVSAVLMGSASAQDDDALGDVYARAGVGYTFANDWEQDFTYNPDVVPSPGQTGQTVANGDGLMAVFALGFDYADGIRTELEYRYAATDIDGVVQNDTAVGPVPVFPSSEDIKGHFLMSNFYFDFDNSSALTPFIGGGVGGAFMTNENGRHDSALALQARAGISLEMGGGFHADLEYVYLRTNELSFGPDLDEFVPGGPAGPNIGNDRYQSSSAVISLRKHF